MAAEDSYEIMPYKEIVELKKQIAELQKKTGDTSSKELLDSMAALTKSMNNMLQLFSSAAEEMKLEEKTESGLSQKVGPLIEKVDRLEEQNKTIAEGMVAIADMVKEITGKPKPRVSPPEPPSFDEFPPLEPPSFGEGRPEPREPPSFDEFPPLEPPKPTKPIAPPPRVRFVPRGPMPPPGAAFRMPPPYGPMPSFGIPPPGPPPDLGSLPPLPPLEGEPKKKGLFGMLRKR